VEASLSERRLSGVEGGRAVEDARGKDNSAAVIVEGDREGQDAPGDVVLVGLRDVEESPAGAVDVGLAGEGDGLEDIAPVAHEGWHLVEDAAAREPVSGLAKIGGDSVVAVQPYTVIVKDLDEDVGTTRERDAGVVEIARIDYNGSAAAFGLQGTERGEEVFDGAVALEEVHVLDAAEVTVERGGEDDDGDVGAATPEVGCNLGAELTGSQVIVEDSDVDVVEEFGRLFDGGGGDALIAVLTKDGGSEMEIGWFVVQQEDTNAGRIGV
jgi:hypothetical protein